MAYRPASSEKKRGGFLRWIIIALLLIVLLPIGAVAFWTWAAMKFNYSSGERAGYVQKISRKGWVCKSWEGELAVANFPGTAPQIFLFSVLDDGVADQIQAAAGKRVALTYSQHKAVPVKCFAETEYYVTGVRVLDK